MMYNQKGCLKLEKIDLLLKIITTISLLVIAVFLVKISGQLSEHIDIFSALLNALGTREM